MHRLYQLRRDECQIYNISANKLSNFLASRQLGISFSERLLAVVFLLSKRRNGSPVARSIQGSKR